MIPKKIHYCWFSGDPYPQTVQDCIASWRDHLPDWEIILWDYDKIKDIDSVWLRECIAAKKWAFAADFVRLWAIYYEGGVYLDSDVMVYQSFDRFLNDRLFIGREGITYPTFEDGTQAFLTSHCFGAEVGHPFVLLNLEYYQQRHFLTCSSEHVPASLRYDTLMMPYIQSRLAETLGYDPMEHAPERQTLSEGVEVYPPYFFCWRDEYSEHLSERYARHIGQGSWREPEYIRKHTEKAITFSYKLRWRLISLLSIIVEKLDYKMVRIHPDGKL